MKAFRAVTVLSMHFILPNISYNLFRRLHSRSAAQDLIMKRFLTINIIAVGKKNGVEPWISLGCSEYEKRISSHMNLNTIYYKSDYDLLNNMNSFKGKVIALDENGVELNSRGFSQYLYKSFEDGGAQVTIIIGGFDGLPTEVRKSYPLLSLSKLTWTHQFARLLLLEQIYRSIEIRKGSSYHKD